MINRIVLLVFALSVQTAFAGNAEDVLALVEKHWDARNSNDYQTQYDVASDAGTLSANSNGTFFQASEKGTLEELTENLSNIKKSNVSVRYPEVTQLSESVMLARYYLEGQIEFADGSREPNYRTRVTHIWVKEGAEWKTRSWHFSPLHNGGVHRD
jgi:ketosteroid isomerase-like protein